MYIEYLLIARDSAIDRDKNTVSVFDIIEDLDISSATNEMLLPVQVLGSVRRAQETGIIEKKASIKITIPGGKVMFNKDLPIKLETSHTRCRLRVGVVIPVSVSGQYKFSFDLDGENREMLINIKFTKENLTQNTEALKQ